MQRQCKEQVHGFLHRPTSRLSKPNISPPVVSAAVICYYKTEAGLTLRSFIVVNSVKSLKGLLNLISPAMLIPWFSDITAESRALWMERLDVLLLNLQAEIDVYFDVRH
jgi:hypothetical protein